MEAFHKRVVASGNKLTTYVCPHCKKTLNTLQPRKNECVSKGFWDSLKRCYECDQPSFVTVYPDGKTEVTPLEIPTHLA